MRSSSMARAAMCSPRPSRFSSHRNDLSPRTPRNPNMANNYVETAFNVPVTTEEASVLEACFLVAERLTPGVSKPSPAAVPGVDSEHGGTGTSRYVRRAVGGGVCVYKTKESCMSHTIEQ